MEAEEKFLRSFFQKATTRRRSAPAPAGAVTPVLSPPHAEEYQKGRT